MEYRVRELLEKFFKSYMNERNLEKALEFVSEDVVSVGTGEREIATGRDELGQLMKAEFSVNPEPAFFVMEDYTETVVDPEVSCAFCFLTVRMSDTDGDFYSMKTRFTAVCSVEQGRWKIRSMHLSTPTSVQAEEEFFPLKYGREVVQKLSAESNRELLRLMTNTFPGGIIGGYLEKGFPLYIINDEMLGYLGYTYEELVRETKEMVIETIAPEDRDRVEQYVLEQVRETGAYEIQYRLLKKNGERMWVLDKGKKIATEEGRDAIISVVIDISQSMMRQEMLKKEAEQDSLTGILNRKTAIRLIEESFQTNDEGVLFVMDIDDFKMLNDTCGHLVGDQVLMGFADILRKNSRSDDVCARLGGDEFLVYFPGLERKETAAERADLIRRQFQQMNGGKFGDVQLSVSIGIAVRQKEESFDHLYGAADQALYQAKRKKKGLYLFSEGAD